MHKENQEIIRELNACTDECNHCYNECLNEKDVTMLARCIELDRECADICQWTASFLARDSEHAHDLIQLCAKICEACADECTKHDMEHCRQCARACRACSETLLHHQD
jgi:hypothetical protein